MDASERPHARSTKRRASEARDERPARAGERDVEPSVATSPRTPTSWRRLERRDSTRRRPGTGSPRSRTPPRHRGTLCTRHCRDRSRPPADHLPRSPRGPAPVAGLDRRPGGRMRSARGPRAVRSEVSVRTSTLGTNVEGPLARCGRLEPSAQGLLPPCFAPIAFEEAEGSGLPTSAVVRDVHADEVPRDEASIIALRARRAERAEDAVCERTKTHGRGR